MRAFLLSIVLTSGIFVPTLAATQSYLSPEEVLQQNDSAFLRPGRVRGAQWAADLQAQQNVERHPSIVTDPWDPKPENELPPPVLPESALPTGGVPVGVGDPSTLQLLERIAQEQMLLRTGILGSTAGMYGAPLAGSGPESYVALGVMAIAGYWTLRKARNLEKFVKGA
jgi:hypothetical protein